MRLDYVLEDAGPAMGLIVLSVDETVEDDFRRLVGDAVRVLHSRIPSHADLTAATLPAMVDRLPDVAGLIPAGLSVVGFACTSGATVLGEGVVEALVQRAHPGVPVTNPLTALKHACRKRGITRLGLVSPYTPDVTAALRAELERAGIKVTAFAGFEEKVERRVARIAPASIERALLDIGGRPDCDAVFASCTNLRAVSVIERVERQLGKPVMASNQVLAEHMLDIVRP